MQVTVKSPEGKCYFLGIIGGMLMGSLLHRVEYFYLNTDTYVHTQRLFAGF